MSLSDPGARYFAITPSDDTDFTQGECRGIYVGSGGNLVAVSRLGDVVTFTGVVAGSTIPIRAVRVNSTDTTASSLVGLYG